MIGNYILGHHHRAIAIIAILICLMPLSPLAFFLSGLIIGLITLRKDRAVSLQVLFASTAILLVFSIMIGLPIQSGLIYVVLIWLPVWLAATLLRITERQESAVLLAALVTSLLIIGMYIRIGDVHAWWRQWLDKLMQQLPTEQVTNYSKDLDTVAPLLNALMASGLMLNIILIVFGARWWQAKLFNPGGFQKEFYRLYLPPATLMVSAMMVALSLVLAGPWQLMVQDMLVVVVFMYLLQGLSAVHRNTNKFGLSVMWLVVMYSLLIVWPVMVLFVVCLGIADIYTTWQRKKLANK